MRLMLFCVGMACVGYLSIPHIEKWTNSYIDRRIEEHMAGIALNGPPPPEKVVPMMDGYDLNRQPIP